MNSIFLETLKKKLGRIPMALVEETIIFLIVRSMVFYIGRRLSITFSFSTGFLAGLSFIIAGAGVITTFGYAGKGKLRDYIGIISLRIFVVIGVSTIVLAVEQLFHLSLLIPSILTIVIITGLTIWGFLRNKKIIHTPLTISSEKIKKNLKVVFISDIHSDLLYGRRHLKKIVNQIIEEKPDFVLVGGDIVNTPQATYAPAFTEFQRITVPIYAVIGNHDVYFGPFPRVITEIFKVGKMLPLRNETLITHGIQLVGIDDKILRKKKSLTDTMNACNIQHKDLFTIFLTHRPIHLSKVENYPIDLELAGHTHNGQIRGLHFLSRMMFDYNYGEYSYMYPPARGEGGEAGRGATAFVSQGLGAGIPFRIGTEGEIVIIELKKKK